MRFENPWLLLLLLPAMAAVAFGLWRMVARPAALRFPSLRWARLGRPSLFGKLHWLPRAMQGLALALAVVVIARPQVEDAEELTGEGADFVLVLDMSGSMNAVDMPPERIMEYHRQKKEPPNRFESARDTIKRFIGSREQDRVGLVIFASKAFVKFPLTLDKVAMNRILDGLVLDDGVRGQSGTCGNGCTITGESTAIGDALGRAWKRLEDSETKSRNIILITDGDNNAGKAAPEEVARFIGQQSADRPVHVYTFLVGSGKDTFMPARNPFTGQAMTGADGLRVYDRPKEQFPVNPTLLAEIARLTGGAFHDAPTEDDFRKEFEDMEKTRFRTLALEQWREAFVPPLAIAFALWALGEALALTAWRRWP